MVFGITYDTPLLVRWIPPEDKSGTDTIRNLENDLARQPPSCFIDTPSPTTNLRAVQ